MKKTSNCGFLSDSLNILSAFIYTANLLKYKLICKHLGQYFSIFLKNILSFRFVSEQITKISQGLFEGDLKLGSG